MYGYAEVGLRLWWLPVGKRENEVVFVWYISAYLCSCFSVPWKVSSVQMTTCRFPICYILYMNAFWSLKFSLLVLPDMEPHICVNSSIFVAIIFFTGILRWIYFFLIYFWWAHYNLSRSNTIPLWRKKTVLHMILCKLSLKKKL